MPRLLSLGLVAAVTVGAATPVPGQELPQASAVLPEGQIRAVVQFEMYRRWMMVPVTVEDSAPLRFILDSGAPITVLASLALGQTLPLEIIGQAHIGGAGDGAAAEVYVAGNVGMSIGDIRIEGAALAVGLGEDALGGADGVIGGPVFENFVVEIDWFEQELTLHDPARWSADPEMSSLPLRRTATGHLATIATLSVAGEPPVPVELLVDTGAGHALSIEPGTVAGLGAPDDLLEDVLIGWGANGAVYGDIGRSATLRLGSYDLDEVVTTFPSANAWSRIGEQIGEPVFGNLGAQVLQRFRVVIDVPHARLYLQPNAAFDAPFAFDQAGMALLPTNPGSLAIEVADVVTGSPAAEAGVRTGDAILSIDGRPVSGLQPEEVQRLFEGPSGHKLRVTFRRGESVFEAQLELRPLI